MYNDARYKPPFILNNSLKTTVIFKACGGLTERKDIKIRERGYTQWINSM